MPETVIAVGQWAIISPYPGAVDPDFLAWYLNHPATGLRLARLAQGSKLQFLSLGSVREFEVDVPPLEVQRRIARVAALHGRITELEQQLGHARQQLVDTLTMDALRRASTVFTPNT